MVKVDEVGLSISSLLLRTVSGIVTYLSTVETGVVHISCSLGHSSLVVALVPSSLATSPSPIAWCTAPGQIHRYGSIIHRCWGISRIILWSSTSSLSSRCSSPIVLRGRASLAIVIDPLVCCSSSLCPDISLTQQSIYDGFSLCKSSYFILQGIIGEWSWWFKYVI